MEFERGKEWKMVAVRKFSVNNKTSLKEALATAIHVSPKLSCSQYNKCPSAFLYDCMCTHGVEVT